MENLRLTTMIGFSRVTWCSALCWASVSMLLLVCVCACHTPGDSCHVSPCRDHIMYTVPGVLSKCRYKVKNVIVADQIYRRWQVSYRMERVSHWTGCVISWPRSISNAVLNVNPLLLIYYSIYRPDNLTHSACVNTWIYMDTHEDKIVSLSISDLHEVMQWCSDHHWNERVLKCLIHHIVFNISSTKVCAVTGSPVLRTQTQPCRLTRVTLIGSNEMPQSWRRLPQVCSSWTHGQQLWKFSHGEKVARNNLRRNFRSTLSSFSLPLYCQYVLTSTWWKYTVATESVSQALSCWRHFN